MTEHVKEQRTKDRKFARSSTTCVCKCHSYFHPSVWKSALCWCYSLSHSRKHD